MENPRQKERDLVRLLATKALSWKIKDDDVITLEWVSLVEKAFPLSRSQNWRMSISTRVQVIVAIVGTPHLNDNTRNTFFNAYLEQLFQPGFSKSEPAGREWVDALTSRAIDLRDLVGSGTQSLMENLNRVFPRNKYLSDLQSAVEKVVRGLCVDLRDPHNVESVRSVGFSDDLLSDLTNNVSTPSKVRAIEKVLQLGDRLLLEPLSTTPESSLSFGQCTQPAARSEYWDHGTSADLFRWTPNVGETPAKRVSQATTAAGSSPITPVFQHSPGILTVLSPGLKKKGQENGKDDQVMDNSNKNDAGDAGTNRNEDRILLNAGSTMPSSSHAHREEHRQEFRGSETENQGQRRDKDGDVIGNVGQSAERDLKGKSKAVPEKSAIPGGSSLKPPQSRNISHQGSVSNWVPPSAPGKQFSSTSYLAGSTPVYQPNQRESLNAPSSRAKALVPSGPAGEQNQSLSSLPRRKEGKKRKAEHEGLPGSRVPKDGQNVRSRGKSPRTLPAHVVIKKYIKRALKHPDKEIEFPTLVPKSMRGSALRAERVVHAALKRLRSSSNASKRPSAANEELGDVVPDPKRHCSEPDGTAGEERREVSTPTSNQNATGVKQEDLCEPPSHGERSELPKPPTHGERSELPEPPTHGVSAAQLVDSINLSHPESPAQEKRSPAPAGSRMKNVDNAGVSESLQSFKPLKGRSSTPLAQLTRYSRGTT